MNIAKLILLPFISASITLLLTPLIRKILTNVGIIDFPDHRKKHKGAVPTGGGIAISLGFLTAILISIGLNSQTIGLVIGATTMTLFGFLDDVFDLSPFIKLIGQIIGAVIAVYLGVRINLISDLLGSGVFNLGFLAIPITLVWIIGVTNVINLLDGLDGLAAGVVGISASVLGFVAVMMGKIDVAILSFTLAASSFAFLPHNFSEKNKIFMGDAGSNFLGFSLAVISVLGAVKVATIFSILVPILVLAIPIFDTSIVILKRILNGKSILEADREHFHHKLIDIMGLGERQAVFFIYTMTLILGGVAILSVGLSIQTSMAILGVAIVILAAFILAIISHHQQRKNREY